jgi:thioredoxin-like negative regulator of GroEL
MAQDPGPGQSGTDRKTNVVSRKLIVVFVVLAAFAGVFVAKAMTGPADQAGTAQSSSATAEAGDNTGASAQDDALATYEAALKTGKPIYLMFHSTTCQPCVEIAAVAKTVIPHYAEKIAFVDAVTDSDPSVQQLAAKFPFQYIPQSFFLNPDGTTADSFTGAMTESDMRARLDALLAKQ